MAISLEKGQKISLEKTNGDSLKEFCVGVNWGAIEKSGGFFGFGKKMVNVDLDLSCVLIDSNRDIVDYIYSPYYREDLLARYNLKKGKLTTDDNALKHSGDDRQGDSNGDDELDNEIVAVDLSKLNSRVQEIYFFLNNVGQEDFSQIPYAKLRMYEGTPSRVKEVFASYNVASESKFSGKRALIMGKLVKTDGKWSFAAMGDATEDLFMGETIQRIRKQY